MPRPLECQLYDQEELVVALWVDQLLPSEDAVRVDLQSDVPPKLKMRIKHRILDHWVDLLETESSFRFEAVFEWVSDHYAELLGLCPDLLYSYEAVDENGMTVRRYQLLENPVAPVQAESGGSGTDNNSGEESDSDLDEEIDVERERLERIRLANEAESDRQWREQRRKEAEELGEAAKEPRGVSKKEQQARIKEKQEKRQGHRLRKQGARANKFDAKAAGKKPGKNGLMT